MLFTDLRATKLNTISGIEAKIAELQELLSQEQGHLQAIGSVEQAAVSAIDQVRNAINGISAICPSELAVFKAELMGLFDGEPELLPPSPIVEDAPSDDIPLDPSPTTIVNDAPGEQYPDRYVSEARDAFEDVRWEIPLEVKTAHIDGLLNAIDRVVIHSDADRPDNLEDLRERRAKLPQLTALAELAHIADRVLAHYATPAPAPKKRGRKPKAATTTLPKAA